MRPRSGSRTSTAAPSSALPGAAGPTTVFVFTSTDCPIANRYAPELRRIHDRFAPRGALLARVRRPGRDARGDPAARRGVRLRRSRRSGTRATTWCGSRARGSRRRRPSSWRERTARASSTGAASTTATWTSGGRGRPRRPTTSRTCCVAIASGTAGPLRTTTGGRLRDTAARMRRAVGAAARGACAACRPGASSDPDRGAAARDLQPRHRAARPSQLRPLPPPGRGRALQPAHLRRRAASAPGRSRR